MVPLCGTPRSRGAAVVMAPGEVGVMAAGVATLAGSSPEAPPALGEPYAVTEA